MLRHINKFNRISICNTTNLWLRFASSGCTGIQDGQLTTEVKHQIEKHWRNNLGPTQVDVQSAAPKKYVLSMFPYPSGNLHMGHVRVYTIGDAMARFYRMQGYNVLYPMGWDAFGLPAENAAIERKIAADEWTKSNIQQMKEQFASLGYSFDWSRELATCDPKYYKWTQWLFLQLYKHGLAYQKEALVNWDPVDKTVLADEQVDVNGCSWRSGAKVEKKLLKQWFVKTTNFAKPLLDGLDDPSLEDWRDIIKLQKHWIGDCNGYTFDLLLKYHDKYCADDTLLKLISLWTDHPEDLKSAAFVAVTKDHVLNKLVDQKDCVLDVHVVNPFDGDRILPVIITDEIEFPDGCDTYLGVPARRDMDKAISDKLGLATVAIQNYSKDEILQKARDLNIGGYLVSSKLKDWPISRQRVWGTPIPIVHCKQCGPVPFADADLPVIHDAKEQTDCPSCGDPHAKRETDTMDTFVDSSWYYVRYADPKNEKQIADKNLTNKLMPVDLYVGGKEHAVLHLYYARFFCHFMHSIGLVQNPEPFTRLLVQGMVMGRSYRVKGSGKYLKADAVKVINAKKNQAEEIGTGNPVVIQWEKMSKSKYNGVEPSEVVREHGADTLRLIMLGDVAPTSQRNWSEATFPGILNWQKRLWLTLQEFHEIRSNILEDDRSHDFEANDAKLYDARNYFLKEATFNYQYSHQLSVAISKMQGLTNAIRRSPKDIIKFSPQYERALAAVIQMIAPMAPHFASELWAKFLSAPNRINTEPLVDLDWNSDVMQQRWPTVDNDYQLDLIFKVNGVDVAVGKHTKSQLARITPESALEEALQNDKVCEFIGNYEVVPKNFVLYPECEAILSLSTRLRSDGGDSKKTADLAKQHQ